MAYLFLRVLVRALFSLSQEQHAEPVALAAGATETLDEADRGGHRVETHDEIDLEWRGWEEGRRLCKLNNYVYYKQLSDADGRGHSV